MLMLAPNCINTISFVLFPALNECVEESGGDK